MKYIFRLLPLLLFVAFPLTAQNKKVTLEEIWNGSFRQEYLDALHPLKNGREYAVLNFDRSSRSTSVDVYAYQSGEKTRTLVNSANLPNVQYFQSYALSEDESKILLATDVEPIYRHSSRARFFVYDVASKSANLLTDQLVQEPTFSPDGTKVAYVFENNIYIKDLRSNQITQVTTDGEKNKIINGITDWVYEEEFAFVRAFQWNKDGNRIAYIRFDETEVPEFSMDIYGKQLYPGQDVFKYPKAGEKNAEVSLHLFELNTGSRQTVNLRNYNDFYIPRIKWTNDADVLSVQVLNRHQNDLDLLFVNAKTNGHQVILNEKDAAYVDIKDDLTFLNDNSFIWTSEKDGNNHIYHYNRNGKLLNQITSGNWEVTSFYGFDPKNGKIFYQSTENGSINRDVYSIQPNGRNKQRLSSRTGTNSAQFNADFTYYIGTFTNSATPYVFSLHDARNGKLIREIKNNNALKQKEAAYGFSEKEFSTIRVNGNDLNMWMIRPTDFDASKQYPVLVYQYSGPGSQTVANVYATANDYWYQLLANEGYIVVAIDPRGTGFKGAEFKKVTQNELGKYEVEDMIEAARILGQREYVDADRIGIWGWSYGGFMSSNAILKGNDVYKMAIAVAPVTSWRFYDTIYTERYMTTPQENPSGYDDNSPINHVEKLKGAYLLVHGSADDNVHVQNTMRMIEALVQANKQFDWAIYPDKNHGIYGGNTRLHLYTKMTNFIKENL